MMESGLTPPDRMVLDRLLGELSRRLDGAVDFWTLVCLGQITPDPRGFLLKNGDVLRSLVVVLQAVLPARANEEKIHLLLNALREDCQHLQDGFLLLLQFQSLSPAELRTATEELAACYPRMQAAIRGLADDLGTPVSYLQGKTPEREAYYARLLDGLFETFRQQCGSAEPITS